MKLSIDLGSTEFKAAVFADAGEPPIGSGAAALEYVKYAGKVELQPEIVKSALIDAVAKALESAGIAPADVNAVGVDSQAQTFTIADDSLNPRMNFISWLDQRAASERGEMEADPLFADFAEHSTIAKISAPMTICLLKHLAKHSPRLFEGDPKILPLPSYALSLLAGEYATDGNIAAMSGLYSLRDREYRTPYIDYIHPTLTTANFPKVLPMGAKIGTTATDNPFGLAPGIPAHTCGNDQTAGAFGADLTPGDILITLGTAQVAYACLESMPAPVDGLFRGWYPGGLYYAMFAENGGDLISTAIKQCPEFGDFARFAALAERGRSGGVKCEPDVRTNSISWSDNDAPPEDKARSVFEFLTDRMADMVSKLKRTAGKPKTIYVTGGGTRRAIWVDTLAEKIGNSLVKVRTSPENGVAKLI